MHTNLHNERSVASDSPELGKTLAQGMERVANIHTVYGEPVMQGNITVIPVARASWLGAGGGERDGNGGSGMVGALQVKPVGYIEIKEGNTRFKSFFDLGIVVQIVLSYGVVAAITFSGVSKVVRAARQKH